MKPALIGIIAGALLTGALVTLALVVIPSQQRAPQYLERLVWQHKSSRLLGPGRHRSYDMYEMGKAIYDDRSRWLGSPIQVVEDDLGPPAIVIAGDVLGYFCEVPVRDVVESDATYLSPEGLFRNAERPRSVALEAHYVDAERLRRDEQVIIDNNCEGRTTYIFNIQYILYPAADPWGSVPVICITVDESENVCDLFVLWWVADFVAKDVYNGTKWAR